MASFTPEELAQIRESAVTLTFRHITENLRFARMKDDNQHEVAFWEAVLELVSPKKDR